MPNLEMLAQYNQFKEVDQSVAERSPGAGFTRMPIPRAEGLHTGGPFVSPDGTEVWKPLDTIINIGNTERVTSQEHLVLRHMEGEPGFPKNWTVEFANQRLWLVRPKCRVIGQDIPWNAVSLSQLNYVRQAVRGLNAQHWEVHDLLSVALDPVTKEPFILDLSSAYYRGFDSGQEAYDYSRFIGWAKETGNEGNRLAELIVAGIDAAIDANVQYDLERPKEDFAEAWREERHKSFEHVYLCLPRYRRRWESVQSSVGILNKLFYHECKGKGRNWFLTAEALTEEEITEYGLKWVDSPIKYAPIPSLNSSTTGHLSSFRPQRG